MLFSSVQLDTDLHFCFWYCTDRRRYSKRAMSALERCPVCLPKDAGRARHIFGDVGGARLIVNEGYIL